MTSSRTLVLLIRSGNLRDIFIQIYIIQSLRVLGLSMGNGVSIPDALASCREVVSNRVFQAFLVGVEHKVNEGSGFAAAFQQADFMPPTVKQMVTTGEETGNLPKVLGRIADYYERELARKLAAFSRMVEPIMLIVMGAGYLSRVMGFLGIPAASSRFIQSSGDVCKNRSPDSTASIWGSGAGAGIRMGVSTSR